jgi:DNA-binding GntR family transcriptional regulator
MKELDPKRASSLDFVRRRLEDSNVAASPARKLMAERAYETLKGLFQSGTYPPGSFLSERQLSHRLGMSKTPIKSALVRLELEGFIKISPQQGIVVRELSVQEIVDLFDIREALECYVARRVAGHLSAEQVAGLLRNLKEMEKAVRQKDVQEATRLDTEFHATLCDCLGNREISQTLWRMREKLHRMIFGKLSRNPARMQTSAQEHAAIAEAVIRGQGERAAELIRKHLGLGLQLT